MKLFFLSTLDDVRTLCLPGNIEGKISHLGISLKNFVRLKTLDLSYNALTSVSVSTSPVFVLFILYFITASCVKLEVVGLKLSCI